MSERLLKIVIGLLIGFLILMSIDLYLVHSTIKDLDEYDKGNRYNGPN